MLFRVKQSVSYSFMTIIWLDYSRCKCREIQIKVIFSVVARPRSFRLVRPHLRFYHHPEHKKIVLNRRGSLVLLLASISILVLYTRFDPGNVFKARIRKMSHKTLAANGIPLNILLFVINRVHSQK